MRPDEHSGQNQGKVCVATDIRVIADPFDRDKFIASKKPFPYFKLLDRKIDYADFPGILFPPTLIRYEQP